MARIILTAIASEIRGKLNGNVFGRNKGGQYVRNKVTPINPRSAAQQRVRSQTSDIAKAWSSLTDEQRQSWTTFGSIAGSKSVFGNSLQLSGIAAYQKVNKSILNANGTRQDDAPVNRDVDSIGELSLTASTVGPTLQVVFSPAAFMPPNGLYIFATPPVSPGISNLSSRLRYIGYFTSPASPLDILAEWTAVFGAFPVGSGQRIGITAQVLDITTGAITAPFGAATLVV